MVYNLTAIANSSGIVSLFQLVNDELMRGQFGIMILISVWIISFMSFVVVTGGDGIKAMATSSFLSFIICIFLRSMKIVPDLAILITLVMTALFIVMIKNR